MAKRVDPISLPTYPQLKDQNFTQYLRNLTSSIQWFADQAEEAIDTGLVPYQSINISATVSNGATGMVETFAVPLPAGTQYTVLMVPHWNAGGLWLTPTSLASFTMNWATAPAVTSSIDFIVVLTQLTG